MASPAAAPLLGLAFEEALALELGHCGSGLTRLEGMLEVLGHWRRGRSNAEIATDLSISETP